MLRNIYITYITTIIYHADIDDRNQAHNVQQIGEKIEQILFRNFVKI